MMFRTASLFLIVFAVGISFAIEFNPTGSAGATLVVVILGVAIPAALALAELQRSRLLFRIGVAAAILASALSIHGLYRLTDSRTHLVASAIAALVATLIYLAHVLAPWTSNPSRGTKRHWAIRALQWIASVFFQALVQIIFQLLIEIVFAVITGGRGGGSSASFGGGTSGGGGASGRW